MKDGFKVIDADRHVLEPSDLFARYLPAKFRDRVRIEGPNQSGVPLTANRFPTRTRCGRERNRKTTGSPLARQRAGVRLLRTRWWQSSTPHQTSGTWTAKVST